MDFIEAVFGISPDGGDGSLEALYLLALSAVVITLVFRRRLADFLRGRIVGRRS